MVNYLRNILSVGVRVSIITSVVIVSLIIPFHFFSVYYLFFNNTSLKNILSQPDSETLLSLLGIILAFAGVVGFLIYELIRSKLSEELKKVENNERKASYVETCATMSYTLGLIYSTSPRKYTYLTEKMKEYDEKALFHSNNLPYNQYKDIKITAINNMACTLADTQFAISKKRKGVDNFLKNKSLNYLKQIWEFLEDDELGKFEKNPYTLEETCIWVKWCFAENNTEKSQAIEMLDNLKNRSPEKWYKNIRAKYTI